MAAGLVQSWLLQANKFLTQQQGSLCHTILCTRTHAQSLTQSIYTVVNELQYSNSWHQRYTLQILPLNTVRWVHVYTLISIWNTAYCKQFFKHMTQISHSRSELWINSFGYRELCVMDGECLCLCWMVSVCVYFGWWVLVFVLVGECLYLFWTVSVCVCVGWWVFVFVLDGECLCLCFTRLNTWNTELDQGLREIFSLKTEGVAGGENIA